MVLIRSIEKHVKGKLAGYLKQATKLIHGSEAGDRMPKTNDKAKVPREIPNAPNVISKPATTTAIADAHVGDSEVVPNELYDYNYWAWNELPPTSSEPPPPPKPSTASAPKLKGQEPTVDEADRALLELATISEDFRIRKRPLLAPNHHHLPLHPNTDLAATSSPPTSAPLSPLDRAMWVSKPHSLSSASPSSPTRFQKSPFFGKKLGPTPRISRIPSVSCALDPEASAVEGPASTKTAGSIMVGGSDKELEGHSGDEGGTLRGFEAFGGENGRRPFVEILADLRTLLHHKPSSYVRITSSPSTLSVKDGYELTFAMIRELRACLGRMDPVRR